MKNQKETTDEVNETEPVIKTEITSVDHDNGIVLVKTDAEDGTGFTLDVDGRELKAKATGGLVWFYNQEAIGENPAIRLL